MAQAIHHKIYIWSRQIGALLRGYPYVTVTVCHKYCWSFLATPISSQPITIGVVFHVTRQQATQTLK